jgi:hypothetical protein
MMSLEQQFGRWDMVTGRMLAECEDILGMHDDRFLSIDDPLPQNFGERVSRKWFKYFKTAPALAISSRLGDSDLFGVCEKPAKCEKEIHLASRKFCHPNHKVPRRLNFRMNFLSQSATM